MATIRINKEFLEAVESKNIEGARQKLAQNAEINCKDRQGRTALHIAIENYNGPMVRFLALNGANMHIENASRTTALNQARDLDAQDIFRLLSSLEQTSWKPGDDPDSLLQYHDVDYAEQRELLILERSQIQEILTRAKLDHHFPKFEQHKISFIQFLRLDEHALEELGIEKSEDRRRIAQIAAGLADRKWQKDSILPNFMLKNVSSAEITCILKNLESHIKTMSSTLNYVRSQQIRNPDMLRHNLEAYTMENLSEATDRISKKAENLIQAVHAFSESMIVEKPTVVKKPSKTATDDTDWSFAVACVGIATLNCVLWGVGAALYFRSRNR